MFTVLDTFFPADLTNYIMGFLAESYLTDPKYHHRVYHKTICERGEYIPRPPFEQVVWKRRYKNPYCPEGVKLEAFNYIPLPKGRILHISARSFLKFQRNLPLHCACMHPVGNTHKVLHWVTAILLKLLVTAPVQLKRMGWDISVPFILLTFVSEFQEGIPFVPDVPKWREKFSHLQWDRAEAIFLDMILSVPSKTYPVFRYIGHSLSFSLMH